MERRLMLALLIGLLWFGSVAEAAAEQRGQNRLRSRRHTRLRTLYELEALQPPTAAVTRLLEPGWRPQPLRLQDVLVVDPRREGEALRWALRLLG